MTSLTTMTTRTVTLRRWRNWQMGALVQTPTLSAVGPETAEILTNLSGECGETVQAISKVLQHGPFSAWPEGSTPNNIERLAFEIGNLLACVEMLAERGVLPQKYVELGISAKQDRLPDYSHGELAVRAGGLGG
jgi:hypothetical protein